MPVQTRASVSSAASTASTTQASTVSAPPSPPPRRRARSTATKHRHRCRCVSTSSEEMTTQPPHVPRSKKEASSSNRGYSRCQKFFLLLLVLFFISLISPQGAASPGIALAFAVPTAFGIVVAGFCLYICCAALMIGCEIFAWVCVVMFILGLVGTLGRR